MATQVPSYWEEIASQRRRDKRFVGALWKEHKTLLRARKLAQPKPEKPVPVEVTRIMVKVAQSFGLTLDALTGRCRIAYYVDARAAAILLLRRQKWSTPEIGRFMGRDHTSILHALEHMDIYWKRNPKVPETVERLDP